MENIRKCHCGNIPRLERYVQNCGHGDNVEMFYCVCEKCGMRNIKEQSVRDGGDPHILAIKVWNQMIEKHLAK